MSREAYERNAFKVERKMRAQDGVKSDGAKTKETKNDPMLSILFHNVAFLQLSFNLLPLAFARSILMTPKQNDPQRRHPI